MELSLIITICGLFVTFCYGDYTCLCNYNVEIPVYVGADSSTQLLGYMYEFDCKNLLSGENPAWFAIEFEHKLGYVEGNGQIKVQTCPGEIPDEDKIKFTSVPVSTLLNAAQSNKVTPKETSFTSTEFTPVTHSRESPLSSSELFSSTSASFSKTALPLFSISAVSLGSRNPFVSKATYLSSVSDKIDSNVQSISPAISKISKPISTSILYTLLYTPSSLKTNIFNESTSKNQTYSTKQSIDISMATNSGTNLSPKASSSTVSSTRNPIIPLSHRFTNVSSSNLVSTSVSIELSKNSFSPSFETITSSSEPTPLQVSRLTSTASPSPKSSLSLVTRPETTSYNQNLLKSASVTTSLPLASVSSTQENIASRNSITSSTATTLVSDRVDLCPYENLAMSTYNRTTFTYPLFRQYDHYCYELRLEVGNWFEAQNDCVSRGGELAVIPNDEVQARVYSLTSSLAYKPDVWIGLNDLNKEGQWEWVNGQTISRSSYNRGVLIHPAYSEDEDCVLMDGKSGVWKNTACKSFMLDSKSYPWVCQYKMT